MRDEVEQARLARQRYKAQWAAANWQACLARSRIYRRSARYKAYTQAQKEHIRAVKRAWIAANRDHVNAGKRASYARHRESYAAKRRSPEYLAWARANSKRYLKANRAKVAARRKRYYAQHKERILFLRKLAYRKNRTALIARTRAWSLNNPKKRQLMVNRRMKVLIRTAAPRYIRYLIRAGMPAEARKAPIPRDWVEAYRSQLLVKRLLQEIKHEID